ncbi:hypothetical protein R6Q59_002640 [Mikania micrantha]
MSSEGTEVGGGADAGAEEGDLGWQESPERSPPDRNPNPAKFNAGDERAGDNMGTCDMSGIEETLGKKNLGMIHSIIL